MIFLYELQRPRQFQNALELLVSGRTHRALNGCEREDVTDLLLSGLVMIEVVISDELLRRRALGSNWCLILEPVC